MKNTVKLFALFLFIAFTSCSETPVEYYNKAVSLGNSAIHFEGARQRIERLENNINISPVNLLQNTNMRLGSSENMLEKAKGLIGNTESDAMLNAAITYLEHDIENIKNPTTIAFMEALGEKITIAELDQLFDEYGDHITEWHDTHEALWKKYNEETSNYAKANNLLEEYYGVE